MLFELIDTIRRNRQIVTASAAVALVVTLIAVIGFEFLFSRTSTAEDAGLRRFDLSGEENRVVSVVKASNPAVVSIIASRRLNNSSPATEIGGGTGFIVTPDGLIVTNKHVIDDAGAEYTVYAFDGKRYPAKIVAKDPTQDIAIVKISDGRNLPYLSFGDSSSLRLGQTVIAIGNVFDQFKNSVSVGVVSGLSRNIIAGDYSGNLETLDNVIQTDAAINPGNSGGPLLDTNERVVGVNVAIARGSVNIGFALPANTVKSAVDSVMRTGKIQRPYLGIRYIAVNELVRDQYSLPYNYGALVLSDQEGGELAVATGSPADRAGIEEGDVILEIDGRKLSENETMAGIFQSKNAGDTVDLKVWHEGQERQIKVRLGEFPIG